MSENTMTMQSAEITSQKSEDTAAKQNVAVAILNEQDKEIIETAQGIMTDIIAKKGVPNPQNLRDELTRECEKHNQAVTNGESPEVIKGIKKDIRNKAAKYADALEREYYKDLVSEYGENALKEAIKKFNIPIAKVAYRTSKSSGLTRAEITKADKRIDLQKFAATVGNDKFANPKNWATMLQSFAYLLAHSINDDVEGDKDFQYAVKDAAKTFRFPECPNDYDIQSKRKCTWALQQVVDAIVYIPSTGKDGKATNKIKMFTKDWMFIYHSMAEHGEEDLSLELGDVDKMCWLVAEQIHAALTKQGHKVYVG